MDFKAAAEQMCDSNSSKPLPIFCVSAKAFVGLRKGQPLIGFPRLNDSGIPVLQKWLNETTFANRDRNALAFLEDIFSLELSMIPWLADTSADFRISKAQRKDIEASFAKHFQELEEVSHVSHSIVQ